MSSSVSISPSINSFSNEKVGQDPGYIYNVMDPLPGQKYVEYSKNMSDGESKVKGDNCGLNVHKKGRYIYLCKVKHPAPSHNLHIGDRVIAINGKKIEKYNNDLSSMVQSMTDNNVVRLVVDPTMLRKK
jgi:predicted metalloprotease with PDZ domain